MNCLSENKCAECHLEASHDVTQSINTESVHTNGAPRAEWISQNHPSHACTQYCRNDIEQRCVASTLHRQPPYSYEHAGSRGTPACRRSPGGPFRTHAHDVSESRSSP